MKVIYVYLIKRVVLAKLQLTLIFCSYLAMHGNRILAIDIDPPREYQQVDWVLIKEN